MGPLGLRLGMWSMARGGSAPAPTPTPTPSPTKIIFEGDSQTSISTSMANTWITANPSVEALNLAVAGSEITGTNSVTARLSQLVTEASGFSPVLVLLIGGNDVGTLGAAAWQTEYSDYIASVRSAVPGITIIGGTMSPKDTAVEPSHNAERAVANPWLRGLVGTVLDAIVPYGEHPVIGTDAAGFDTAFYGDGRHPTGLTYGHYRTMLDAVLTPFLVGATGNTPSAFTFADFEASTVGPHYSTTIVTGMGLGQSASASATGTGDFARNTLPAGPTYSTGPTTVMNGDLIVSRVSRPAADTPLTQHTLTIGSRSDTWDITNAAAPATTVWDQARSDPDLDFPSARQAQGPASGQPGYNSVNNGFADKGYAVSVANKRYFEMTFYGGGAVAVAVAGSDNSTGSSRIGGGSSALTAGVSYRSAGDVYLGSSTAIGNLGAYTAADTIGVAIDYGTNKVWFLKNGVSISGDPAAGTGGYQLNPAVAGAVPKWFPACYALRDDSGHILNCGQDPFNYSPPAGFIAYG